MRTLSVLALAALAMAQQPDFSKVEIKATKVAGTVYMLEGAGGNIGVSVGEDGIVIVDDQFAPLSERITAAIAKLTPKSVRFVINTHWHGDHTGGNENLGSAGAIIVAHENVRKRMSSEQFIESLKMAVPASPKAALPVVTFAESVTLHLNGDDVRVVHVPPAHTDGDAVVFFTKANVVHLGDLFFNGSYPFIDVSSGGSVDGLVAAVDRVLSMTDDRTKFIPGHGPLGDRAALQGFRTVVATARERVGALVARGATLDEVKAARPMKDYDEKWGAGFVNADLFLSLVYSSLAKPK
jgi:glyoxylase-like metal-dependent hydrolase (beta-lactamase superfamily II)